MTARMDIVDSLLAFLNDAPVSYLAVARVEERLASAGYRRLDMAAPMPALGGGETFFVTKNDSALFAFRLGSRPPAESGFRLICAHSDSPTFRLKPYAALRAADGTLSLDTEVYGGPILSTWMDRPLSLAGRVILRTADPLHPATRLLHVRRPLLLIPNLAIHFNRSVNDGVALSRQKDMLPVLAAPGDRAMDPQALTRLVADELQVEPGEILDCDLSLYDTQPACRWGLEGEFISSGRIDDLSMVHAAMEALLAASPAEATQVLAIFDNEETGSGTKQGAASPVLRSIMERVVAATGGTADDFWRAVERSFMVSADNAHAFHPNHAEKYDPLNRPVMGGGPVIKYNAAQKYATDADGAAVFAEICRRADVPYQRFANHSDIAGGSTLGNILTAQLPLRGVDMGAPVWAMHSARESASAADHAYCTRAFTTFYQCPSRP